MNTTAAELNDSRDLEHLACAAPFVFLLVAAADGTVDKKELKRFSQLMADEEYAILAAVMVQAGLPIEQLLAACQKRLADPVNELMSLGQVIDNRLPGDTARQFKAALLKLGHAIAQASGGFFGFGKKMDEKEAAMLALIIAAFSQSGASESEAQAQGGEAVLNDELFPALKPAEWVKSARGHVAMQNIFLTDEIRDDEPVVGYVHDNPQTVAFVPSGSIGDALSIAQLHQHAMDNLERRLAAVNWEELSFDAEIAGFGTVGGLVLAGDYFASEALLSESIMKKAHERLNSAMLMAIAPQRGELFVTQLISEEDPEPERVVYAQFAIKKFFKAEQAPISPNVFIVRNGKVVGHISGMEDIIAQARSMAEAELKKEAELLDHRAQLKGVAGNTALEITVTAHCIETMYLNLQHAIRNYTQAASQESSFNGSVNVVVTVTDSGVKPDDHNTVVAELNALSQFLTEQFASLNMKGSDGSPVSVACEVEFAAAA